MTYGLDTSVVLRLATNDPADLSQRTVDRIRQLRENGNDFIISDVAINEIYYALQHHYQLSKMDAIETIRAIAASPGFSVSPEAMAALETPEAWKASPGMIDRMIANGYAARGYVTISCERSFAKLDLTEVIK